MEYIKPLNGLHRIKYHQLTPWTIQYHGLENYLSENKLSHAVSKFNYVYHNHDNVSRIENNEIDFDNISLIKNNEIN